MAYKMPPKLMNISPPDLHIYYAIFIEANERRPRNNLINHYGENIRAGMAAGIKTFTLTGSWKAPMIFQSLPK